MAFDRRFCNAKKLADAAIAVAGGKQLQDLRSRWLELRVRGARGQCKLNGRREKTAASSERVRAL